MALCDGILNVSDGDSDSQVNVNERVRGLVTFGAIIRVPMEDSGMTCMMRSVLKIFMRCILEHI